MKLPRGFGKNYFTLSAITATVNHITLHAYSSRIQSFHTVTFDDDTAYNDDEEPDPALLNTPELSLRPCHCNRFYSARTQKAIKLHTTQKTKPQIFIILDSSIAPPRSISTSQQINRYKIKGNL